MELLLVGFATSKVFFWRSVEKVETYKENMAYIEQTKKKVMFFIDSGMDCYAVNTLNYIDITL